MIFLPSPSWLTQHQSPTSLLRPEMRNGLVGLWLPFVGNMGNVIWDSSGQKGPQLTAGNQAHTIVTDAGLAWDFDGTDDYYGATVANYRAQDSQGTILTWLRTGTNNVRLVSSSDIGSTNHYFGSIITSDVMCVQQTQITSALVSGSTVITDSEWHLAVITSDSSTYKIFVDGGVESLTGSNNGDWFADTTLRDNLTFGAMIRTGAPENDFNGQLGPIAIWSYPLSESVNRSLADDFWNTMFRKPPSLSLKASAAATTTIQLDWIDNSEHEDGFSIERKTDAGAFAEIDTVAADVETYDNVNVPEGHTYTYRVKATSTPLGDSEYSNEAAETV